MVKKYSKKLVGLIGLFAAGYPLSVFSSCLAFAEDLEAKTMTLSNIFYAAFLIESVIAGFVLIIVISAIIANKSYELLSDN